MLQRWNHGLTGMALILLAACSGNDDKADDVSQVVATIDGAELTASQFENRMKQLPVGADPRDPVLQKEALESMIDEAVLAKAAAAEKIDRKPSVIRQLDQVRGAMLAAAYLDIVVKPPVITAADAQRFYVENPQFFGQRRIYGTLGIAFPLSVPGAAGLARLTDSPNAQFDGVVAAARAAGFNVAPAQARMSADMLPPELARSLAQMTVGDTASYTISGVRHMDRITSITDAPVSFEIARSGIETYLANIRRAEAIKTRTAQLRSSEKIEYGTLGKKILAGKTENLVRKRPPAVRPADRSQTIGRGADGI